jgi:hypothetical protein
VNNIDDLISDLISAAQELGSDQPALGAREELEIAREALRAELEAVSTRIKELLEQADSTYAPYRQMVQEASEETNKFSARVVELEAELAEAQQECQRRREELELAQKRMIAAESALRERDRWISVGKRLPEFDLGLASHSVEVAYRVPESHSYLRMETQYWKEYGWEYEWKRGQVVTMEQAGYVVDFWREKTLLPEVAQ